MAGDTAFFAHPADCTIVEIFLRGPNRVGAESVHFRLVRNGGGDFDFIGLVLKQGLRLFGGLDVRGDGRGEQQQRQEARRDRMDGLHKLKIRMESVWQDVHREWRDA